MNGSQYLFDTRNITSSLGSNASTNFLVSSPNLSNSEGLSFFGVSDSYSGVANLWDRIENQVASNAAEQTGAASSTLPASEIAGTGGLATLGEVSIETGIAEASTVGASVAGPLGLALMVNQQLGQAVAQGMSSATETQIASDKTSNLLQHGLNVDLNANMIQANQEATRQNQETGAMIGSMFGPIGALIGHAIAGYVSASPSQFQTASSFNGPVDPTDTGIVATQSTSAMTGQSDMVDNVTS